MTQKTPVTIRIGTLADAPMLAELGAATFMETFAAENTPDDMADYLRSTFTPERLTQELSDPRALFLIAEFADCPVGYSKLDDGRVSEGVIGSAPCELVRLYVSAAYIGQGVGAALMQECIRQATARGFQTLWLGVWEHNLRAQAFYRKWGFEQVGAHIFQLGSDAQTDFLMQRTLTPDPA